MPQHDSSFVRSVGYDWDAETLTLRLGQRRYEYAGVPEEVYQQLLDSESLGVAYNASIKRQYPCREVT